MKHYEISRTVPVAREKLWAVLADPQQLTSAHLGILRIEGNIGPGQRIRLWFEASPQRPFSLKVSEWVEGERMVWSGGMPLGLFRGVRQFNLRPKGGGTEFHMREDFSGLMLPLIWKSMPDLNPSFEKFAAGLERAACGATE